MNVLFQDNKSDVIYAYGDILLIKSEILIIVGLHCGFEFRETTSVEFKSVPKDFWAFKSDFAEFK